MSYDSINFVEMDCPKCNIPLPLEDWQTKDGPRNYSVMEYTSVRNFYTFCGACGTCVEFDKHRNADGIIRYDLRIQTGEE